VHLERGRLPLLRLQLDCWEAIDPRAKISRKDHGSPAALPGGQFARLNRCVDDRLARGGRRCGLRDRVRNWIDHRQGLAI
jgi:hypothetical protein